jgi:hypothetical protein
LNAAIDQVAGNENYLVFNQTSPLAFTGLATILPPRTVAPITNPALINPSCYLEMKTNKDP